MINVGILGAGGIAALSHLPEIAEIDGIQLRYTQRAEEQGRELADDAFGVNMNAR